MNFDQLVRTRYSQRSYDPERPVPQELLTQLLETAHWAPSAANRQPWQILVIQSAAALNRIHPAYPRDWFLAAPCVLAVKGWRSRAWTRAFDHYNSLETDLAILTDHLTLAAADLGLGTCWIANFDPLVLAEALELQADEVVFSLSPLGYPASDAPPRRPSSRQNLSDTVRFL